MSENIEKNQSIYSLQENKNNIFTNTIDLFNLKPDYKIFIFEKIYILALLVFLTQNSTFASEATHYLSGLYSKEYKTKVHVVSKKEYCDKYEQEIGGHFISSIVYGHADMKIGKSKKQKVSYICLFKNNHEIFWGYIIPR